MPSDAAWIIVRLLERAHGFRHDETQLRRQGLPEADLARAKAQVLEEMARDLEDLQQQSTRVA